MHKHNSSHIDTSDYDPNTQTLKVKFKSGSTYHYHDVPSEIHDGLITSFSPGKFLNEKIKKANFKFTKQT